MEGAAGLESKSRLPVAKKKRLSLRDHGGPKQPGSEANSRGSVEVRTVARNDLSSYFVIKGTQKVVQCVEGATQLHQVHLVDEECTILNDFHAGIDFSHEDCTQRTLVGSGGQQFIGHISTDCPLERAQNLDEELFNIDANLPVDGLEQVVCKYDKPLSLLGQEHNQPAKCLAAQSVLWDLKGSGELQNVSHEVAYCRRERGDTFDEAYDDARGGVEDRRYDKPGSSSSRALDIKTQSRFDASSAFRDDLFFDEETYDAGSEAPSGKQWDSESQAEVTAREDSAGTDLSFRDSFYKGGTDWSALYEVDEYGLPCAGSPPSSSRGTCLTKDWEELLHPQSNVECKVVKGDSMSPGMESRVLTPRSSWCNKDEEKINVAKRLSKLKQVDLSSFLGLKRNPAPEENVPAKKPGRQDIGTYFGSSPHVKQPSAAATFLSKFRQVDTSPASSNGKNLQRKGGGGWRSRDETPRSCPFYKKMPGTPFTVDAFKFGAVEGCKAYFLSHFHSDHYGGLTRSWSHGPIFCTLVTARLVSMCLGVDAQWLHPVELGVALVVEGVEVRFLEANHCPGAALILFQTPGGQRILHTGDFRACKGMQTYPELLSAPISSLYLDTTYCNPKYNFPLQEDVINFVIKTTRVALARNPKTLVAVGAYSIGKERVYLGIAKALDLKIFADKRRGRILSSLDWPDLTERLCGDASSSRLHVLPISHLNATKLRAYMQSLHPRYSAVLGFRPTGWTYSEKVGSNLQQLKPQCSGAVTIYGVPYSEHSSFAELQEFVQFFRPQKIIATVNIGTAAQRESMQFHFNQWLRS